MTRINLMVELRSVWCSGRFEMLNVGLTVKCVLVTDSHLYFPTSFLLNDRPIGIGTMVIKHRFACLPCMCVICNVTFRHACNVCRAKFNFFSVVPHNNHRPYPPDFRMHETRIHTSARLHIHIIHTLRCQPHTRRRRHTHIIARIETFRKLE